MRTSRAILTVVFAVGLLPGWAVAQLPTAVRAVEPVVLTGVQIPDWSGPAADTECQPYPSGSSFATFLAGRDAHNGIDVPTPATGVAVGDIVAFRWDGVAFVEIPVQVDERYYY